MSAVARRVGKLALVLVVIAFLAVSLPRYLSGEVTRSLIPPPPEVPAYYPLLVAHVLFAAVAMLTACVQISSSVRRRWPALHRRAGRVYAYVGVLPAGAAGLALGAVSPFGPVLRVSNVLLALLWLSCTAIGLAMAWRRRRDAHRRWMTRSLVLTFSIITNRVWAVVATLALAPQLETTFGGNPAAMVQAIAGLSGWLGWVLPLVAAEWWLLERGRSRAEVAVAGQRLVRS